VTRIAVQGNSKQHFPPPLEKSRPWTVNSPGNSNLSPVTSKVLPKLAGVQRLVKAAGEGGASIPHSLGILDSTISLKDALRAASSVLVLKLASKYL
jgi:hypothetical protein